MIAAEGPQMAGRLSYLHYS